MKFNTNTFLLLSSLFLFTLGCASSQLQSQAMDSSEINVAESKFKTDRLLIWEASLNIEAEDVNVAVKKAQDIVKNNDGYIVNQNIYKEERATLTIKIPSKKLHSSLDAFASLGNEKSRDISSEDVTDEYVDLEARLKNSIALRDRLKMHLDKATNVKEILDVERELNRVQSDIDSMEGRMKRLTNRIEYSLVTFSIERSEILGPLGYIGYGIGWVIKKLFIIR